MIQYVILEGEPGASGCAYTDGKCGRYIEKPWHCTGKNRSRYCQLEPGTGGQPHAQLIEQHQNKIELVLANNDDMALGAIDAYEKKNFTESTVPSFFGIDGTAVGLEAVSNGKLSGTVYNDKTGQAQAIVKLSEYLVLGKSADDLEFTKEKYIYTPYKKVTAENVDMFIDE